MKPHLLLFIALCMIAGCSKAPAAKSINQEVQWVAPVHTSLEVYITNYSTSPKLESKIHPNLKNWRPSDKQTSIGGGIQTAGKQPYSVNLEYTGTKDGEDHYCLTIMHPLDNGTGSSSLKVNVTYSGKEKEVWKDSEYRIGLRPETDDR